MSDAKQRMQSVAVPTAIIVGFALVALAIYFSGNPLAGSSDATGSNENQESTQTTEGDLTQLNPVTEDDHIRGNPNAPIVFVEYSDYDCPYCKNFHETMQRIMSEYGANGDVAWVYRHFPIKELHPSAPRIAAASECVANLGGNSAFWTFTDLIFSERSVNESTDMSRLDEFASEAGIDTAEFNSCLESGEYTDEVEEDRQNAIAVGGRGTPHTVVLFGDEQGVINGAQPYATVRQIVESLLSQETSASSGESES